jgi:hypothetical protein
VLRRRTRFFEELGYHRPTSDPAELTYVSEGKVGGPKGFFHWAPDDAMLDVELFREWLSDRVGIDSDAVDSAFRTVLGGLYT